MRISRDKTLASPTAKWLTVVGIGADGLAGLSDRARAAIAGADHVFGGTRHLALAARLIEGAAVPWPSPFDPGMAAVLARRGQPVCVLASGDPMWHGVGVTLARHVAADEMVVIPAPSAFSLAAARLTWPLAEVATLSLHGRALAHLRPHLAPGRKLLALTSDGAGPAAIADYLTALGLGHATLTVLEDLGGPAERVRQRPAADFDLGSVHDLNLVAIEFTTAGAAAILPAAPGLPDDWFAHDGQLTKRELRALTLSALRPTAGQRLWDIGGGAGSVAIEWLLAGPAMAAIGIERVAARAEGMRVNAENLGAPQLQVVVGAAPAALADLPRPDAIFIGGGGSQPGVMAAALAALPAGGRLVANAVTLQMEAILADCHTTHGGQLRRIAVQHAEAVGRLTGWRPAMPVTQWMWRKP
ncbi:MAG: precorrin-6y C5,15-methyltransferase (decarboxylating) subunit CbiE [Pseudomonadota bacterium]|nr:precorrin-6y C5,15-methyltransferase (decarboxylating) subunit CbiE [Pseudomonadota bacterium]